MATVRLPEPLRRFCGGRVEHDIEGGTLGAVLRGLAAAFPELRPRLFGTDGGLLPHLMVFLDGRHVRFCGKEDLPVQPGAEVRLLVVMEGG